jgi:hypothetical protein
MLPTAAEWPPALQAWQHEGHFVLLYVSYRHKWQGETPSSPRLPAAPAATAADLLLLLLKCLGIVLLL